MDVFTVWVVQPKESNDYALYDEPKKERIRIGRVDVCGADDRRRCVFVVEQTPHKMQLLKVSYVLYFTILTV